MGKHDWMIACLIEMVEYSEREGLSDVSKALKRSISRIAPSLKGAGKSKGDAESVVIAFRKVAAR